MSIVNNDSVKPQKTPAQKRQTKMALITISLVVGAIVIAYYFLLPKDASFELSDYDSSVVQKMDFEKTVQASGTTQIPLQMTVPNLQEAYVVKVNVEVGDYVELNDVLAIFSVPELDETISDLELELKQTQRELVRLKIEQTNEIEDALIEIDQLNDDIIEAQEDVDKYQKLVNINASRLTELEDKQEILADLKEALATAKIHLNRTKVFQELDVASKEDSITSISTNLSRAVQDKEDTNIKSPMTGEIIEMDSQLAVIGSTIEQGVELFTVADASSAVFQLELSEEYSSVVKVGDSLKVSINSKWITSTITSIGKIAQASSDGLGSTVTVVVTPTADQGEFLLGSTAIGEFSLGVQKDVLTLPRGSYLTTGSQRYVYVINGKTAVKTAVTFGDIQGNTVQILTGLEEGDVVITSGYQNYISEPVISLKETAIK